MLSNSISEYQKSCQELIGEICSCPSNFFDSLLEMRSLMLGHQIAYERLHLIERKDSFNRCFNEWLCQKVEISNAIGWVAVIKQIMQKEEFEEEFLINESEEDFFFSYACEFLNQWNDGTSSAKEDANVD